MKSSLCLPGLDVNQGFQENLYIDFKVPGPWLSFQNFPSDFVSFIFALALSSSPLGQKDLSELYLPNMAPIGANIFLNPLDLFSVS